MTSARVRARLTRRGGGAILHFAHPPIPDTIGILGAEWRGKREFHVTLAGTNTMRSLIQGRAISADEAIARAASKQVFAVILRDEFWEIREKTTRTLVRLCDVEGAEEFFTRLERELERPIERPPYHVTLFTIGTLRGIGIGTQSDLQRLGRELVGEERTALTQVLG